MIPFVYFDPLHAQHDPGHAHPEGPWRLDGLDDVLAKRASTIERVVVSDGEVKRDILTLAHSQAYVDRLLEAEGTEVWFDHETGVGRGSIPVILRAAAGTEAVVRQALESQGTGVALVRPPGHHAGVARASGYCLVNNIAIAAKAASEWHGVQSGIVVDIDAHYGDGTAEILADDLRWAFWSVHQEYLFPNNRGGLVDAAHRRRHVPLRPGSGDVEFRRAVDHSLLPLIAERAPQLVLVSLGTDGHASDPMSDLEVTTAGYIDFMTTLLTSVSCPVVCVLEGGYDPRSLAAVVAGILDLMAHFGR